MQERFLLRPGETCRDLVDGVLGRSLALFKAVRVHAYHVMSNHVQLLLSTDCGEQLAGFLTHFFGNTAQELGRLHDWDGHFWARRARVIPVLDDDAVIGRMRYILAQGVKEGLVHRPEDWPGASSTRGLLGQPIVGTWINRDRETRARKRRRPVDPETFTTRYAVELAPLPPWANLDAGARRARIVALIDDVVREARSTRAGPPLGVAKLLAVDPHGRPDDPARSPAPLCHASTAPLRAAFRRAYRLFCDAFCAMAATAQDGLAVSSVAFPSGSFPRPTWHVSPPANGWPPWLPPEPSGIPDSWRVPGSGGRRADGPGG